MEWMKYIHWAGFSWFWMMEEWVDVLMYRGVIKQGFKKFTQCFFRKHFIQVKVEVDPEPRPGRLDMKREYTTNGMLVHHRLHLSSHSFTVRGILDLLTFFLFLTTDIFTAVTEQYTSS